MSACPLSSPSFHPTLLTLSHTAKVLHGQDIHVQEPIHTVGQTPLLVLIQRSALHGAGDAFLPACIGEGMGLTLNSCALLLVGDELAELGLVFVVELVKVGLVEGDRVHVGSDDGQDVFEWERLVGTETVVGSVNII
jgi:hypothetical protein